MSRKISLGLCIALIIVAITATFSITMLVSKEIYNNIITDISQRSQMYDTIDEISQIVSNYFYGSVEDRNRLNSALAEGYVMGLADDNSRYLDADEYATYTERTEGGVKGVGLEAYYDYSGEKFVVTYVYESSPAKAAGLLAGDVITAINGEEVTRTNYSRLYEQLYGNLLSKVEIRYERGGTPFTVEPLTGFAIPSVIYTMNGNAGYIRINGFYKNTAEDFRAAVESLENEGAEGFIFDVRNTTEGTIDYAVQTIDVIVPAISGNIAIARDENGSVYKEKLYTAESNSVTSTFVILINENTSGPAELFACDLRDICQAKLVGETTAGVGTMSEIFTLEDGGAVLLTVAQVEPYGGQEAVYNGTGLTPDLEVSLLSIDSSEINLLNSSKDEQLIAAVRTLE